MVTKFKTFVISLFILTSLLFYFNAYGVISPIRRNQNNEPLLTNCNEIHLIAQNIDLYHHPLGIWLVECTSKFQNLYPKKVNQEMGFSSGYDIGMLEGELYCDEFQNFRVHVNGDEVKTINLKESCPNFVERIGIEWSFDDNTGIGFINTWLVEFEPEEIKQIKVSFSFVVKKPPIVIKPDFREAWYDEMMTWMKQQYSQRPEHDFKLLLNMGSFWALPVDSLTIRSYNSNEWLTIEDETKRNYKPEDILTYSYSKPVGFFSPSVLELNDLTKEDLKEKSSTELKLLRNSFFGKYGRKFDTDWLKLYFKKQPWYYENPDYDNWYLTDFDIKNMKFIFEYEKQKEE